MRIFTDTERRQLRRKPGSLDEVSGVSMSDARLDHLRNTATLIVFRGDLVNLERMIQAVRREGIEDTEFVVLRHGTEEVYALNTEGYDYARYLGRIR